MKNAAQMLIDVLPTDLQARLSAQPEMANEYTEPGFSLSLLKRLNDRLHTARRRHAHTEDGVVRENLSEIIDLLEEAKYCNDCVVWQGYFIDGTREIEFVLAPTLSRRVIGRFESQGTKISQDI